MKRGPRSTPWMAAYKSPQKDVVEAVRRAVLAADRRIGETIDWQAADLGLQGVTSPRSSPKPGNT